MAEQNKAGVKPAPVVTKATQAAPDENRERKYIFRLLTKSPNKMLPMTNLVYDEQSGRQRKIRLVEGVRTFWKDEQDEMKLDNNIADNQAWRPQFIEGFMTLTYPIDKQKIEYMLLLDGYDLKKDKAGTRPAFFTLENREGKAEEEFDKMMREQEAVTKAYELAKGDLEALTPHAKYLNISFVDGYGNPKSPAAIKGDYVKAAKAKPDVFLKSLNSPIVKVRFAISKALGDGTIDINHMRGQAHWGDTKAFITTLDMLKNPEEYLTDFALSGDGVEFLQRLRDLT